MLLVHGVIGGRVSLEVARRDLQRGLDIQEIVQEGDGQALARHGLGRLAVLAEGLVAQHERVVGLGAFVAVVAGNLPETRSHWYVEMKTGGGSRRDEATRGGVGSKRSSLCTHTHTFLFVTLLIF